MILFLPRLNAGDLRWGVADGASGGVHPRRDQPGGSQHLTKRSKLLCAKAQTFNHARVFGGPSVLLPCGPTVRTPIAFSATLHYG